MSTLTGILVMVACGACLPVSARTWTSTTGQTVEGDYVSTVFDSILVKDAQGKEIKLPIDRLSEEDRAYIELRTPPELRIDYYDQGSAASQVLANDWYDNGGVAYVNHPVFVADARFGARVRQTSSRPYNHPLTIEMYVFTKQYLDPDKYHMIFHRTSEPFYLNKENELKHQWLDKSKNRIIYYNLYSEYPRGERLGEHLILVRDIEGNIVSYNASGKWLFNNLEKLQALPVGAWINDRCDLVHPSSPKRFD